VFNLQHIVEVFFLMRSSFVYFIFEAVYAHVFTGRVCAGSIVLSSTIIKDLADLLENSKGDCRGKLFG
jgi:hypothetical protein